MVVVAMLILLAVLAAQVVDLVGVPGPGVRSTGTVNPLGVPGGPSAAHPFGVDGLGRDVLSRVLYGLQSSLKVSAIGTAIATGIGAALGMIAALAAPWLSALVIGAVEALLVFPALLLGFGITGACSGGCVGGLVKPGARSVVLVMVLATFPLAARLVHGHVRALRQREFVRAAPGAGVSRARVILSDLAPPVVSCALFLMAVNILLEAGLTFLGAGLRAPDVSLGAMIGLAGHSLGSGAGDWWNLIFPGLVLSICVLAFALVGRAALHGVARALPARSSTTWRFMALRVASGAAQLALAVAVVFVIFGEDLDLGRSQLTGRSVVHTIVDRLPASLSVLGGAALVSILLATPIVSVAIRSRAASRLANATAWMFASAPVFWVGLLGVYLLSANVGRVSVFDGPGTYAGLTVSPSRWLGSLLLPWLVLAAGFSARLARLVRTNLTRAMAADYIVTARSKGLSEQRVIVRHGLRAALPPTLGALGGYIGTLAGGVILIEVVFNIPGVGRLTYEALRRGDIPVLEGVVLFGTLFVVVAKLSLGLLYVLADPRVRDS